MAGIKGQAVRTILWGQAGAGLGLPTGEGALDRPALDVGKKILQIPVGTVNPDMALGFKGLSPLYQEPHLLYLYYTWGFRAQGTEES